MKDFTKFQPVNAYYFLHQLTFDHVFLQSLYNISCFCLSVVAIKQNSRQVSRNLTGFVYKRKNTKLYFVFSKKASF